MKESEKPRKKHLVISLPNGEKITLDFDNEGIRDLLFRLSGLSAFDFISFWNSAMEALQAYEDIAVAETEEVEEPDEIEEIEEEEEEDENETSSASFADDFEEDS